jgi:hypothetical protein
LQNRAGLAGSGIPGLSKDGAFSTLKVGKFQNQIFLPSFEPKNERNYFSNSAQASKMGQIKKIKALYYIN